MRQIGLVSYAGFPDLTDDDRLLIPAFRRLGVEAECAVWDAPVDSLVFIGGAYSHSATSFGVSLIKSGLNEPIELEGSC